MKSVRIDLFVCILLCILAGCVNERSFQGLLCDEHAQCPDNFTCNGSNHCEPMSSVTTGNGTVIGANASDASSTSGSNNPNPSYDTGPSVVNTVATASNDAGVSASASSLYITPSSVDFGAVEPATSLPSRTVVIHNSESNPVILGVPVIASDLNQAFQIIAPVSTTTLAAGQSLSVMIQYLPRIKSTAPQMAALQIATSDPSIPSIQGTLQGSCPTCPAMDVGCDAQHPIRIWPTEATPKTCTTSIAKNRPTTGVGSPNWTVSFACAKTMTFTPQIGHELLVHTWGTGCECVTCQLWHVAYTLEEATTSALGAHVIQVEVPDTSACPGGKDASNITLFTPQTTSVLMSAIGDTSGGEGFYFQLCSE